jgi:hypothetical protein
MRKFFVVGLLVLLPVVAHGNPVDPFDTHYFIEKFPVAAFVSLTVESVVVGILLVKRGARLWIFGGYFVTNLAVYRFVFCKLVLLNAVPVFVAELVVLLADCIFIKTLLEFKLFHGEDYEGVSWLRAGGVSLVGNVTSFVAGIIGIIIITSQQ